MILLLVCLVLLVLVMRNPVFRILAVGVLLYAAYNAEMRHDAQAAAAATQQ